MQALRCRRLPRRVGTEAHSVLRVWLLARPLRVPAPPRPSRRTAVPLLLLRPLLRIDITDHRRPKLLRRRCRLRLLRRRRRLRIFLRLSRRRRRCLRRQRRRHGSVHLLRLPCLQIVFVVSEGQHLRAVVARAAPGPLAAVTGTASGGGDTRPRAVTGVRAACRGVLCTSFPATTCASASALPFFKTTRPTTWLKTPSGHAQLFVSRHARLRPQQWRPCASRQQQRGSRGHTCGATAPPTARPPAAAPPPPRPSASASPPARWRWARPARWAPRIHPDNHPPGHPTRHAVRHQAPHPGTRIHPDIHPCTLPLPCCTLHPP